MNKRNRIQRVLHVDDDEDVRSIAQLALRDIGGLDVCTCASGQEAIDRVQEFAPDVLLVDSMMPDLSGEETVKRIRTLPGCSEVPVIFLTAVGHDNAMKTFRELKPAAIILKPFDPITLCDELKNAVAENGEQ